MVSGAAAEQPARTQHQKREQNYIGHEVADLRPEVPLAMRLHDAEQQPAQDRAGNRAEPADHHGDQALQRRPHPEHRRDLLVDGEHKEAGNATDRRRTRESEQHGHLDIDADEMGCNRIADDGAQA